MKPTPDIIMTNAKKTILPVSLDPVRFIPINTSGE